MKKTIAIEDLTDDDTLFEILEESEEPVFLTINKEKKLVVMKTELYEQLLKEHE